MKPTKKSEEYWARMWKKHKRVLRKIAEQKYEKALSKRLSEEK